MGGPVRVWGVVRVWGDGEGGRRGNAGVWTKCSL